MTRADVLAFARRDWSRVEEAKTQYWLAQKAAMTPAQVLAHADVLRRHALDLRPDWPDEAARQEDLLTHIRVAEALRAVPFGPR